MLVVPALGVKLSKRRRNGAVSSKVRLRAEWACSSEFNCVWLWQFVDLEKICGVAVNEAITFSNVVYSLVIMVEGQSDMVLPFEVRTLGCTSLS
jgi:hypothetical protein